MKKLLCLCLVLFACQTVQIKEGVTFERVNQGIYIGKDVIIIINKTSITIQSIINPLDNTVIKNELRISKGIIYYKSVSGFASFHFIIKNNESYLVIYLDDKLFLVLKKDKGV